MVDFEGDRSNLVFAVQQNVDGIGIDSDRIWHGVVLTKVKAPPWQLAIPKHASDVALLIANIHADDREIRFRIIFNKRPPS